ncbi:MAG: ABC transporter permease [Saprospiraceae bacterium]|nr:ABC transporter permease [Saprospiraceae bacterium]
MPLKLDEYLLSLQYGDYPDNRFPGFINMQKIELAQDKDLLQLPDILHYSELFDSNEAALSWLRSSLKSGHYRYFITSQKRAEKIVDSLLVLDKIDSRAAGDLCKFSGRNLLAQNTCFLSLKRYPSLPDYSVFNAKIPLKKHIPPLFLADSVSIAAHLNIKENFLDFVSYPDSVSHWLNYSDDQNFRYYLTFTDSARALIDDVYKDEWKITGNNLYQPGTAFVSINQCPDLPDRPSKLLPSFFYWLKQVFKGNLGKADISNSKVESIAEVLWKNGIINLFWTILVLVFISIIAFILADILVFTKSRILKFIISTFNDIFSAIPDFLIALFLFISFYRLLQISISEKGFFDIFKALLIPSLGIAFANGNISGLTRLLEAKMKKISQNDYVKFLRVNGLKERFIRYKLIFKEVLPDIIEYNSGKFALIFGAIYIFEKLIGIPSLGYIAVDMITARAAGFIVCFFFFINLLVIVINLIAKSAVLVLSPPLRKKKND